MTHPLHATSVVDALAADLRSAAYTTDGAPVLDAGEADHGAWRLLGQGGLDMEHTAALLKRSVGALDQAQSSSTGAIDRMVTQLDTLVSRRLLEPRI